MENCLNCVSAFWPRLHLHYYLRRWCSSIVWPRNNELDLKTNILFSFSFVPFIFLLVFFLEGLLVLHTSVKSEVIHLNSIGPLFSSTKKKNKSANEKKKLHTHTAYYLQTLLFNSQSLSNSSCNAFSHIFSFFTISSCVPLFISNRFVHFIVKNVYCCCEHTLRILQITEKINQTVCCTHGWMWIVSQ